MHVSPPPPTLRTLLTNADLDLRPAGGAMEADAAALDHPIRWVHSSDLADPTPFLSEGLALLTTGIQFTGADGSGVYDAYVARLATSGVVALGFGTDVVREGVPPALIAACRRHRIPLFEVPYGTPFIAIARANAEAVAAQAYARRSWALGAQRQIALAALKPDALGATLAELARQLNGWVGLFDAAGVLERHDAAGPAASAAPPSLGDEARHMLRRGGHAAATVEVAGASYLLQTVGAGARVRGVIATEGGLDPEARGVVTFVVALAGLALEQERSLGVARSGLRGALIELLRFGATPIAERVAGELWGGLPAAPVRIAVTDAASDRREALLEALDTRADAGPVIYAGVQDSVVLVRPAVGTGADALADVAARHGVRFGESDPVPYDRFEDGLVQARIALQSGARAGVWRFDETAHLGVIGLVPAEAARAVARARLAPLVDHDAAHGSELIATLRAWLEHDGEGEATARTLGIHRHTVRTRTALAARLLDRDLRAFAARAELWADLRALGG
ncbi:PucR family transcriptional regulator [Microbacterium sp. LRZ72]|uniref:PucR family transcriptional regulator n=1 Tax=Microbacterium sp. LRZ72 TaxID=2942481 RepID=UPI0029BD800F|nr:PucR family transcriptional regulator [Microbacterium sp. LRZ72]MDX2376814.1 PucR family transcriptional regulator [Microbacterium sp. LRZ72]